MISVNDSFSGVRRPFLKFVLNTIQFLIFSPGSVIAAGHAFHLAASDDRLTSPSHQAFGRLFFIAPSPPRSRF